MERQMKRSAMFRYGLHGFGYNFLYYWISAFFAIFCTDVAGINAGVVSGLILFCRCFDVLNDPIIGNIVDRSKRDKDGNRYVRWVRFASVGLAITVWLTFSTRPSWPNGIKVAWICIMYCIVTVFSTATDIPYGSIHNVLTNNSAERVTISRFRNVLSSIGSNATGMLAVGSVAFFSLNGNTANGYCIAVGIAAVIAALLSQIAMRGVREKVQAVSDQPVGFWPSVKAVLSNRYTRIFAANMFATGFFFYSYATMLTYFFTYYAGDAELFAAYSTVCLLGGFVAQLIIVGVLQKITRGHKGRMCAICGFVYGLSYGCLYFIDPKSVLFYVPLFIGYSFMSAMGGINYSLLGDACDYGELKTGLRTDAMAYSIGDFTLKLGGAVGPALMLGILNAMGYVANQPQTPQVLTAMRMSVSVMPLIVGLLLGVLGLFYDMTPEKHQKVVEELEQLRSTSAAQS